MFTIAKPITNYRQIVPKISDLPEQIGVKEAQRIGCNNVGNY